MKRSEVYKLIDGERDYQDNKRPCVGIKEDSDHSVGDWILFMEHLLDQAKLAHYDLDDDAALEIIRKVTAVGVACMETHETRPR